MLTTNVLFWWFHSICLHRLPKKNRQLSLRTVMFTTLESENVYRALKKWLSANFFVFVLCAMLMLLLYCWIEWVKIHRNIHRRCSGYTADNTLFCAHIVLLFILLLHKRRKNPKSDIAPLHNVLCMFYPYRRCCSASSLCPNFELCACPVVLSVYKNRSDSTLNKLI
jgi:hypothetical protein